MFGNIQISDLGMAIVEENIGWLQISMNNARLM